VHLCVTHCSSCSNTDVDSSEESAEEEESVGSSGDSSRNDKKKKKGKRKRKNAGEGVALLCYHHSCAAADAKLLAAVAKIGFLKGINVAQQGEIDRLGTRDLQRRQQDREREAKEEMEALIGRLC